MKGRPMANPTQAPPPVRLPPPAYTDLFREPVYQDGPYDRGDEDDDTDD